MVAFYVYIPFNILPFIGLGNDLAIEGGSGMRHLERFFVFLPL